MSLDKSIQSGKEHRKPYYDSRRFDHSCRNNGDCEYCSKGRVHQHTQAKASWAEELVDVWYEYEEQKARQ